MLQEFKKFAMRGNVMDMAVGIIIGGAFGNYLNIEKSIFIAEKKTNYLFCFHSFSIHLSLSK